MKVIQGEYSDKIKEVRGKGLLTAFEMYREKHLDGHAVSLGLLKIGVYAKETHKYNSANSTSFNDHKRSGGCIIRFNKKSN